LKFLYVFTRARECAFKRLNEDSAMLLSGGRDILNVAFFMYILCICRETCSMSIYVFKRRVNPNLIKTVMYVLK